MHIPADLHSTQDILAAHVIKDNSQQSYLPSRSAPPEQKEKKKKGEKAIMLTHVQQGGITFLGVIEKFRGLLGEPRRLH